jgi:murein DD-endopeptidase MepM/ murein hydrolase activator NlpD
MKLNNPFKGFKKDYYPKGHKTQGFGENAALYMAAIGMKSHNGEDYVQPWGTPLYALLDGLVCEVNDNPAGYGKHIRMLCDDETGKGGYEITMGHLASISVSIGQQVKAGEMIGRMGNTGFVVSSINGAGYWIDGSNKYAGTHLHLTLREFKYDKKGWRYYPNTPKITILNYDNGWNGAFDFKNMFHDDSVMGDMQVLKRELEKHGDEPWYMTLIRSLRFFGH